MKIAYFCPCLDPGKDGVGDYVRQLGVESAAQSGGQSWLVALNDSALDAGEMEREEEQEGLKTLRLSPLLSWEERAGRIAPLLQSFAPEMVSFHYVPFGFHPRGLVHFWPDALGKLFRNYPLHWMFHEIWVGAYFGAPLKLRLLGWLQKNGIRKVIKKWRPKVIHTSNPAYVALLADQDIPATRLKMYGAIPQLDGAKDGDEWFRVLMKEAGMEFKAEERGSFWFGLFFGTLHTNWPHEPLLGILLKAAHAENKKVALISLGYLRTGEELWNKMRQDYGTHFEFVRLGEKSPEEVARLFAAVDFGLPTSPVNILGKSSSAAAMLDHGLPVLANWEGYPLRVKKSRKVGANTDPLIWLADDALPQKLSGLNRHSRHSDPELPKAARQVLRDMGLS